MRAIKFDTLDEANEVEQRVFQAAMAAGEFGPGTLRYVEVEYEEQTGLWFVPIIEGYEEFFTSFELLIADQNMDTDRQAVLQDMNICKNTLLTYLTDNRKENLTTQQSLGQLQKFSTIKALLEVGARPAAKELLAVVVVDDVFTQERKDKYLAML